MDVNEDSVGRVHLMLLAFKVKVAPSANATRISLEMDFIAMVFDIISMKPSHVIFNV